MNNESTTEVSVELTDNAARRIAYLMSEDEHPTAKLRIAVNGGGCSGFQYSYDFVYEPPAESDRVIAKNGAVVLIDDMSLPFMENAVIDYVETLGAAHFEIRNPNASAKCGCGNSFAV
jgi:iron-sulfur cluster insertion protein